MQIKIPTAAVELGTEYDKIKEVRNVYLFIYVGQYASDILASMPVNKPVNVPVS